MKLESLQYSAKSGWSAPFPPLDSEQTLVVVFGAPEMASQGEALAQVAAAYPRSIRVGCSTSGEIYGTMIHDGSLSVAICQFSGVRLKRSAARVESAADSASAGKSVATDLLAPDLRAVFVLSDGMHVNGSDLLSGINSALPEGVIVTGGLAGDAQRFQKTWVLLDGGACDKGWVSAVGFYGDGLRIGHGARGGWDIFGPERVVTKSKANVVYEIDGQPALQLYKTYLGERAKGLPGTALLFPLSLRESSGADKHLVRTILSIDEKDQSMTFAGNLPEGSLVQLMRANFDRLVDGAHEAAEVTAGTAPDPAGPHLVLAISCVGRRIALGQRTEEEVEAAFEPLPKDSKMIGFYSYGEISPFAAGRCDLHNQTMCITMLAEAA
ncbi:MAG: FIST N-terminal domain-containing protein [Myxococcota bacterium]